MIKIENPIRLQQAGAGSQAILNIGASPLPDGDVNIQPALLGYDCSIDGAGTVKVVPGGTTVLELIFAGAGNASQSGMVRMGERTNDLTLTVVGASTVTFVAECGYELTGGAQAINRRDQYANTPS